MTIKRELILEAMAANLATTAGVGGRVYRSRAEAFARSEAPSLVIEPADDVTLTAPVSQCWLDWQLNVDVIVHTRGQVPEQLASPVQESAHALLMADRSIGGLAMDLYPVRTSHLKEQADNTAGWTVCTYLVRYRTPVDSLAPQVPELQVDDLITVGGDELVTVAGDNVSVGVLP